MPAKNSIKEYVENGYYHVYNRGVEKRDIFLSEQDINVFLSYLKTYLLPKDVLGLQAVISSKESTRDQKDKAIKELSLNNYYGKIELLCYALMPNHFHLLIRQFQADAMDSFLNALSTRYVLYFNRKYHRVGPLYQGVYKAVLINSDEQLLHLTRYIHLNPYVRESRKFSSAEPMPWAFSLPDYLGLKTTSWLKPQFVLDYFTKTGNNSYSSFMGENQETEFLAPLTLDLDDE